MAGQPNDIAKIIYDGLMSEDFRLWDYDDITEDGESGDLIKHIVGSEDGKSKEEILVDIKRIFHLKE